MVTHRTVEEAQALVRQGRKAEAETLYREILGEQPNSSASSRDSAS